MATSHLPRKTKIRKYSANITCRAQTGYEIVMESKRIGKKTKVLHSWRCFEIDVAHVGSRTNKNNSVPKQCALHFVRDCLNTRQIKCSIPGAALIVDDLERVSRLVLLVLGEETNIVFEGVDREFLAIEIDLDSS